VGGSWFRRSEEPQSLLNLPGTCARIAPWCALSLGPGRPATTSPLGSRGDHDIS
jgi:hypothetical protein